MNEKSRIEFGYNPLSFCFGDVRSRTEYEMLVCDSIAGKHQKVDIYQMFVIPNQQRLLDLVFAITAREGKRWLKANGYGRKKVSKEVNYETFQEDAEQRNGVA